MSQITVLVAAGFRKGEEIHLAGDSYQHLFRARRWQVEDRIRIVDGRGEARWGTVTAVDRTGASLVAEARAPSNEPLCRLHLLVSPPKARRLSWLVEKATEVGASSIRLIRSQRSQRRPALGSLERLRRVAVSAMEQSHRSVVPEIGSLQDWHEIAAVIDSADESWAMIPGVGPCRPTPNCRSAALLVGPEGGWTDGEKRDLEALGCLQLGIGPTTLRVETAAVVGSGWLLAAHSIDRPGSAR